MENSAYRAIAIVGAGTVLPDAANVPVFWGNVKNGRYSISDVDPQRWDPALYYDPDPTVADKTYSKIGGWVREFVWDPVKWRLAIPPKVVDAMDTAQKWAIACTREALEDYGYPKRPLDSNRTAVILGNAMAGEKHYLTSLRVYFPEYARELSKSATFAALPAAVRADITRELHDRIAKFLPEITEDSMPGELANCIAGRIANIFNFHGPNFICDAACASAMAAISSAVEGLVENDFDVAITGGIDRNMGAPTFVKFCKIGALSGTGTRPYAEGADGFVMGEGAAIFVLKRLADAERDGDKIYAVLRGMGGSSDGKGKGITAPNPVGQKFAIERAWQNAGLSPATATLMEGHGTSTRVGDVVEVQSMIEVLGGCQLPTASIALGSVKSNIGHLKGAAGAAGFLKVVLALRDKLLPPSVHCERPNPDIDFAHSPFYVNTELKPWPTPADGVRRAGLSAFGFGGTNFHAVLEEYIPHRLNGNGKRSIASAATPSTVEHKETTRARDVSSSAYKAPLRGGLVIGAASGAELVERLRTAKTEAEAGKTPSLTAPEESDLRAPERLAIDFVNARELADKAGHALRALVANQPAMWKALRAQGIFRGSEAPAKVAFLYPGQGSQYVNMLAPLRKIEPIVADTFDEADRVMTPILGKPLSEFIFVDSADANAVAKAEEDLRQTAITQPAVLAADLALTRLLAAYGIEPDFVMGHSLGEYAALVAAGALPFADALEAVSARGREMTRFSVDDNGRMAAVFAPISEIERVLKSADGYVVIANINSEHQAVIGGASKATEQAMESFRKAGYEVAALPVSHAFHTSIVAPASEPLRRVLARLRLQSPRLPIVANTNGEFYPTGSDIVPQMLDILAEQVASPVQFIKGLHTLYQAGTRIFVEVGPKKALQGFAEDVLGNRGDVIAMFTNHPKVGEVAAFNQALCNLYAAGVGCGRAEKVSTKQDDSRKAASAPNLANGPILPNNGDHYEELGRLFAGVLESGWKIYQGASGPPKTAPLAISGAALGLPGTEHIFDDGNIARILHGEQFIDVIPTRFRKAMLDKHITRLVKSDNGGPAFETINDLSDVIKLAGRGGTFDLEHEFGVSADRIAALDRATQLAIAVGIDALRDAGIPLVMRYKTTSKGTQLPDRWGLPDNLRDDTGVIFASAFPGYDSFVEILSNYYTDRGRRDQLALLESLRARMAETNGQPLIDQEIDRRAEELRDLIEREPYVFDRRFLFRTLSMGHSQFAEYIGARGPNTQVNAACASTTQAVALAEDWIRAGRCRRVVVISADDVTSDHMLEWIAAGFLASGAAATDEVVEEAAIPFDRRRHGLIIGMGAAALVVESPVSLRERGLQPICEILGAVVANSAFHGSRLDVQHITQMMEKVISQAEAQHGIRRDEIAPKTVFVSHETYTPARGGSASAEIHALRHVFGRNADQIAIANTKGFTGHAMATGIEDVVAVKALETGCIPPVMNFKEVDPELGTLNLSKGGMYPIEYALRLGAGFGSQISMTLLRWVPTSDRKRRSPKALGYAYRIADNDAWDAWLARVAGNPAELEVVQRTLRVRDRGMAVPVNQHAEHLKIELVAESPAPQPTATVKTETAPPPEAHVEINPHEAEPQAVQKGGGQIDPVRQRVLTLVSDKTGYPVDMLDLDLDLEADLGVDTVKQAEVLATIREAYGIARDDSIKLRDFPTLAHVIRFVHEHRSDLSSAVPAREKKVEVKAATHPVVSTPTKTNAEDSVKERVLALVVEKTGYPKDMLDLDLDLEADLGIDTVKQAEMFTSIRETYNIPRDENRKLRDYPTLAHVIRFVYEQRPDLAAVSEVVTPEPIPAEATVSRPAPIHVETQIKSEDSIKQKVLAIVAAKTGYPEDMLDLDLDLEADLGIDTVKQAEMFSAIRAAYNIPRDENLKLRDFRTLAQVIRFAQDRSTLGKMAETQAAEKQKSKLGVDSRAPEPTIPVLASLDAANCIPRRVPVPVLRPPLHICKRTGVKLDAGSRVLVMGDKGGVANALVQQLKGQGVDTVLIENSIDADALSDLLNKALSARAINGVYWLSALDDEGPIAQMDCDAWHEAVRVRVKLLYTAMRRLYEQIAAPGTFLIVGTRMGGRHGYDEYGVTAPLGGAVAGFAKAYKRERMTATVKAVDFEPEQKPTQIAEILINEALSDPGAVEIGYKEGLRWSVGLKEQPAVDGEPGMTLDRNSVFLITGAAGSIVSAITADLAAASGGAFYLLDVVPEPDPNNPDLKRFLNDKEGLKRDLFNRIQARGERATPALVEKELAGLERAQAAQAAIDAVRAAGGTPHYFAVDLTDSESVSKVMRVVKERSGRIDVLLHAAGVERSHSLPDKNPAEFDLVFDVKTLGFFNLLTAIGDMPLKATVVFSSIAGRFGNAGQTDYSSANDLLCKLTSSFCNSRPSTRAIAVDWTAWAGIGMATRGSIQKMMEIAGIDMLPPEAGVPVIRRELTSGGTRGEVVIGQRLGVLLNEWDADGGVDQNAVDKFDDTEPLTKGPMMGKVVSAKLYSGLTIETTLDPSLQPFLHDHQIDGTPVLPGVMGIEAFAEAALCMLPGWHVEMIEDVNFLAPFKFYRNEPRTVTTEVAVSPCGPSLMADCRLIGRRLLAKEAEPQVTTHFTGRVRLTRRMAPGMAVLQLGAPAGAAIDAAEIYRLYFHGPAYQVLERAWWDGKRVIGLMSNHLPKNHHPAELPTVIAPRLVELCFQTAGLWEMGVQGRMGLPLHIDRLSLLSPEPDANEAQLYAVVTPDESRGSFDAEVVDAAGKRYLSLCGYRTVTIPDAISAERVKKLQTLLSAEFALVA